MSKRTLEFVSAPPIEFSTAFRRARRSFRILGTMCFLSFATSAALLTLELVNYPGGVNRVIFYGTEYFHVIRDWLFQFHSII